uniref:uncharacterized protein isoform X3 n=1 Tax=Myxine glutinosa TaxID=7769 RepID=UPI00358EC931
MAIYMSSDATTDGEEVDVRSSSKFEDSMKGVCFMHVLNKQSKVIPFKEKSARKFRECALEWIQLKGSYESKFAVKALTLDQHSLLHTWTATVGVGLAADAIAITDYEGEGSGRYGDVMTLVFGSTLVVAVSDAATIREALGIGGDVLAGRPPLPLPLLLNNGARGLLCLHPIFWKD